MTRASRSILSTKSLMVDSLNSMLRLVYSNNPISVTLDKTVKQLIQDAIASAWGKHRCETVFTLCVRARLGLVGPKIVL